MTNSYKSMNTKQVYNDAMGNGNVKLSDILGQALAVCDEIDWRVDWSDNDISEVIDALRGNGFNWLAENLETELRNVFGIDPYKYDFVSFFRMFHEDGNEVYEKADGGANMTWAEIKRLAEYEGWGICDVKAHEIAGNTILCVYFWQL
jgi:hypothetical protein